MEQRYTVTLRDIQPEELVLMRSEWDNARLGLMDDPRSRLICSDWQWYLSEACIKFEKEGNSGKIEFKNNQLRDVLTLADVYNWRVLFGKKPKPKTKTGSLLSIFGDAEPKEDLSEIVKRLYSPREMSEESFWIGHRYTESDIMKIARAMQLKDYLPKIGQIVYRDVPYHHLLTVGFSLAKMKIE